MEAIGQGPYPVPPKGVTVYETNIRDTERQADDVVWYYIKGGKAVFVVLFEDMNIFPEKRNLSPRNL